MKISTQSIDPFPHLHKAVRLARDDGFNHVTVVRPDGSLVEEATCYLHRLRLRSEKHRLNTAFHVALVENWRAGCGAFDDILAGRPAAPGHIELLRDHLRARAPRTMLLALNAMIEDPLAPGDPRETVFDTEYYTRLLRAADYVRYCANLRAAETPGAMSDAIRRGGAHTADDIESMLPNVEDVPRRGIPPEARSAWWEVVVPGAERNSLNPLNPLQQETLRLADCMCEELGARANEPLLGLIEDVSALGQKPTLDIIDRRNDPEDPRADRPTLKLMPRRIPIPHDLHVQIWRYIHEVRPRILAKAIRSGNEDYRRAARSNRHILVSSQGRPLSKSMLAEMNRRVRKVEGLDPTMERAQWRNAFADDCFEAFGPTGRRNHIALLMGRRRHSKQFDRYPRGAIERSAHRTLVDLAASLAGRRRGT
jgi:hypothetical protein